ncbi:MAG: hypothetical protein LBI36_07460 [Oscillospiraceae bacterium]|jgi:hypothetical protein|nr:hypothetical protein [Oscillospiraceae bacterium]
MKRYFHCDTNRYRKNLRNFIEFAVPPVFLAVVLFSVCLLLSFRNFMQGGLLFPAVAAVCGVLFAVSLAVRLLMEITERVVAARARYTYLEIGMRDIIISVYAGSFTVMGEKTVNRRLVIVPLSELRSVEIAGKRARKRGRGRVLVKAKNAAIREYVGNSRRLGYYFADGTLKFDEWLYEENGFRKRSVAVIPADFGGALALTRAVNLAKKRFDSLPPEKPYVFREAAFVRERKIREKLKSNRNF